MALSLASPDSHAARARAAGPGRPSAKAGRLHAAGDALDTFCGLGMTLGFAPGQVIVVESDPGEHYFRILTGWVRLYKAIPDGRRQVLDFLGDGDCFGLTGLERHGYTVEAITRVTLARYPRHQLEAAIQADPALARRLFELACQELGRAQRQMLLLGRKTADERIASFLLSLADAETGVEPIHLAMSRQDMADYLGLTIETVSRTLSRFRRSGLIALPNPQDVVLLRRDDLNALAEGAC